MVGIAVEYSRESLEEATDLAKQAQSRQTYHGYTYFTLLR